MELRYTPYVGNAGFISSAVSHKTRQPAKSMKPLSDPGANPARLSEILNNARKYSNTALFYRPTAVDPKPLNLKPETPKARNPYPLNP